MKCRFTSTETVGLLRPGAQDVHLHFHTAHELWQSEATQQWLHTEPLRPRDPVRVSWVLAGLPSFSTLARTAAEAPATDL